MERLDQLRIAMVLSLQGGVDRALVTWVKEHHGEPKSLDSARLRAIVSDFDAFLMQPGVEDSEFTRAMIRLRNVFARHAKMAVPATVTLGPPPSPPLPEPTREERIAQPLVTDEHAPAYAFDANSLLAEALSRLLSGPSWVEKMGVPPFGDAALAEQRP